MARLGVIFGFALLLLLSATRGEGDGREPLLLRPQRGADATQLHPYPFPGEKDGLFDETSDCSINPALALGEISLPTVPSSGAKPKPLDFNQLRRNECQSPPNGVEDDPMLAWPKHVFLLSLESKKVDYEERRDFLKSVGIDLIRWPATNGSAVLNHSEYFTVLNDAGETEEYWHDPTRNVTRRKGDHDGYLTIGERGLMMTLTRLFRHAIAENMESIMVLEEDVVFDCNFKEAFLQVLRDPRCGGHVSEKATVGGVLMLGAGIWIKGSPYFPRGWYLTNHDIAATTRQFGYESQCFNAHRDSFGGFANIYHRDVFKPVLKWIETERLPYDWIYPYLSHLGHPVRVANPFLMIQNVMHVSTIDDRGAAQMDMRERERIQHWDLKRYCLPNFDPLLSIVPQE